VLVYTFGFSPYPELKKFKKNNYSVVIRDRNGDLIQVTTLDDGLRREWTDINAIPKSVSKAFIKAEDKRFYFHPGVDIFSVIGSAAQNIKAGRTVRGASTISMQVVKIIDSQQSKGSVPSGFSKKLRDTFNALRLEARLSKRTILELYLNNVPFGLNVEGVTSAARSFYGCELSELTQEQIKTLSRVPRRPSLYNPVIAKSTMAYVYPFYLPHYVEYLKQTTNFDSKKSYTTTIDLNLQFQAENFLRTAMEQARGARISNGAVLVLDNRTGDILTWIGNNDWFDYEHHGQVDGVLAKNQPGSSMKPFLYALALDSGREGAQKYSPNTILPDIPKEFGNEKLYIPANFNNKFNGPIRFRIALASSLNIPAVSLLDDLGVDKYLEKLYELGFESLQNGGQNADLGLALGAGEVSLKELTMAFAVFTRDGKDFNGNQVYSVDTARLICSILSDVSARALGFGYTQTFQTDYPSIFKTGTANQYQNIVALGSTKEYTVGVWMGNFKGQTVVGKTGSSLPATVAKQILDLLEKNKPIEKLKFDEPENWKKCKICSLSGMAANKFCPATVYEYVKNGEKLEECNWHIKNQTEGTDPYDNFGTEGTDPYVVYPPEYQSWLLNQKKTDAKINHKLSSLKIVTPQNSSLFYYSDQNSKAQVIRVEVIGGSSDDLKVLYDDEEYGEFSRPFIFALPVEKGHHSFSVTCGGDTLSQTFEVR